VRVTARDADAPHARELAARGAAIAPADLEDAASLRAALHDVDVVLAAGAPHRAGAAGERRHGSVPVLDAKHALERRIRELGLTHTILAPVYLMQNAFNPWNVGALSAGRFALALPPDHALQQLAIEDLALVAATVAVRPAAFAGERIALAGDELTGDEAAAALSRVTGRPFAFHVVARDGLRRGCACSSTGSSGSAITSTSPRCGAGSPRSAGSASRNGPPRATGPRGRDRARPDDAERRDASGRLCR
jgi:uncharacterized protein YbjT (DUF2867 family)